MIYYNPIDGYPFINAVDYSPRTCFVMTKLGKPVPDIITEIRQKHSEKLYKLINRRIRKIYPNFNIGITTGTRGDERNYWNHPYRHWLFKPRFNRENDSKTKR